MIKGFLGIIIPGIVILPFMLWQKKWKEIFILPWIPALSVIIVAIPWSIAINTRAPDFWNYFFWEEHIRRFFSSGPAQHPEPFWYYLPVLLGGALPWTILAPAAFKGYAREKLREPFVRYCLCWILLPLILFSISSGKLATYILPCFPALAILISAGLGWFLSNEKTDKRYFDYAVYILSGLLVIGTAGFIVNQLTGFPEKVYQHEGEHWKWLLASAAALSWAVFLFLSGKEKLPGKKLFYFCVAPVTAMFVSHFVIPEQVIEGKAPGQFLKKHESRLAPECIIVSYKNMYRAVCWYYRRTDPYFFMEPGEFKYGLSRKNAKGRFIETAEDLGQFIRKNAEKKQVLLIIRTKIYKKDCKGKLPNPKFVESVGEFTFAEF